MNIPLISLAGIIAIPFILRKFKAPTDCGCDIYSVCRICVGPQLWSRSSPSRKVMLDCIIPIQKQLNRGETFRDGKLKGKDILTHFESLPEVELSPYYSVYSK
jgi:hypothetical protein